jgi:hypothetical protein
VTAPSWRLKEPHLGPIPGTAGEPFAPAAGPVVRPWHAIRQQALIVMKFVLGCLLVAAPFALLLALRFGIRLLDPFYSVLALGGVVVVVLLIIVPSVANHDANDRGPGPQKKRGG